MVVQWELERSGKSDEGSHVCPYTPTRGSEFASHRFPFTFRSPDSDVEHLCKYVALLAPHITPF